LVVIAQMATANASSSTAASTITARRAPGKADRDQHQQQAHVAGHVADADPRRVTDRLLGRDPLRAHAHHDVGRQHADQQRAEREPRQHGGAVAGARRPSRAGEHDDQRADERDGAQHVHEQRKVPGVGPDDREHQAPGFQIMSISSASVASAITM
jgi:hypothetical protein